MKREETTFFFLPYEIKNRTDILFNYAVQTPLSSYSFCEKLVLPIPLPSSINQKLLKSILESLSLIIGISYWKIFVPKKIEIKGFSLTAKQAEFWNTVYEKGLGEFFYKNKIDFRNLIDFPSDPKKTAPIPITIEKKIKEKRFLLGFGGGKDSVVAVELLKKKKIDFSLFVVFTQKKSKIIEETIKKTNIKSIFLYRFLDEKIFTLYRNPPPETIYNGHVPISAIISFIGLLLAFLYEYDGIFSANEKSANEGNVVYLDKIINHQWSKTEEYERLFNQYVHQFITPSISYQSVIRNLDELEIARLFSQLPQYFYTFSSCNKNFKISSPPVKKRWCGQCPKCLFTYLILAPFLPKEIMIKIFHDDLLNKKSLLPLFKQLTEEETIKPFECVGTKKDVKNALKMIAKKPDYQNDYLVKDYLTHYEI